VLPLNKIRIPTDELHDKAYVIRKSADVALDNGVICFVFKISPTTRPGPEKKSPLLQHSELSSTGHWIDALTIESSKKTDVLLVCKHGVHLQVWSVSRTLRYGFAMAQHNTFISTYSPTRQRPHLLHGSTATSYFVSKGLLLMLRHGLDA
jgi:hypothetical protein